MLALVASTVMHSTRHSETAPSASAAATASSRPDDATGALRPLKPAAADNRFMAKRILLRAKRITCVSRNLAGITGEIAARKLRKVAGSPQRLTFWAWLLTFAGDQRWPRTPAILPRRREGTPPVGQPIPFYMLAAMLVGSSISAGFQSMVTKPGVCSTRFSQARMAGKVERSKSQRSATWV
jgi:hypothetical protein